MKIDNLDIKKKFYRTLNERQRRLYTAQLVLDLGHGSKEAVSTAFGIDLKTIWAGMQELKSERELAANRIREQGGGRKKN